jgi:ribosomal protein S6--L-glutamate ligase
MPFPKTYFAARSNLLGTLGPDRYPLVVKPNHGSSCERIVRVDSPDQLGDLDVDENDVLLAQPYLPNPGYDVKLYNTGDGIFAVVKESPLHPGNGVTERLVPMTAEWRQLTERVGRVFGLDIYGVDVVQTPAGWMILDVNDFPSFGLVPDAAHRVANTILRLTKRSGRAPASRVSTAYHRKISIGVSA